jgi:hypothetical protein
VNGTGRSYGGKKLGMGPEGIDPSAFREAQQRNWDSAAVGWMEWSDFNDRADRHISERLVELAGVGSGSRVLDVAVSRWGIIFEAAAEAAAARIRGFLEPGARMAVASWGEPDEVPFLSIPMKTTRERFCVPPPPPGTPGPLSRPTLEAIGGLLEGGGFADVAVERDEVVFEFDSPAHFTAYVRAIAAPVRAMIERHAGEAQQGAWDAITEAAANVGGGSGPLRLSNVVLLASGTA